MKKIFASLVSMFLLLLLSGCAGPGYSTAKHNGKMYYFPENCRAYKYSYSNPDVLHCKNSDGVLTGQTIIPADSQQIQAYQQQQQDSRDLSNALNQFNHDMEALNQKQIQQNQYYEQQRQLNQINNNLRGIRYGY